MSPLAFTVGFSILSACLLCIGQTANVIPFGDGVRFAMRAIELHGLLHTGKFSSFFALLASPSTFTLLPTYILFFAVPTSMATGATYGVINCLCWNLMIALGIHGILKQLGKPRLAPWAFLLTAANNYALDPSYYFYMDLPFAGWALLAIWLQVVAWRRQNWRFSLGAGALGGSLFLVKPANAILFVILFFLAETVHVAWQTSSARSASTGTPRKTWHHFMACAGGMVLGLLVAMPLGLLQVIASRLTAQQAAYTQTDVKLGLVLRMFYFPLCLTYYYSALWLALLATLIVALLAISVVARQSWRPQPASIQDRFAVGVAISLGSSYLVAWGEAFSLVMPSKVIRSLPLMLPILWITVAYLPLMRRTPSWAVATFAATYFMIAHAQAFFGFVPKANRIAEYYHLEGDWLNRLPSQKDLVNSGSRITRDIQKALDDMGIHEGRIADGTEMMFWTATSLNWNTQLADLRQGRMPSRVFLTACDNRGFPIESALDGCDAMLLVVHPSLQYSQGVFDFNSKMASYALRTWTDREAREIRVFSAEDGQPLMVVVALRDPLTRQSLKELMTSEFPQGFSTFAALEEGFEKPKTLQECLRAIFGGGKP